MTKPADDDFNDPFGLQRASKNPNDRIGLLKAMRRKLIHDLERSGARDVASIAKQLQDCDEILQQLDHAATQKDTPLDDFGKMFRDKRNGIAGRTASAN